MQGKQAEHVDSTCRSLGYAITFSCQLSLQQLPQKESLTYLQCLAAVPLHDKPACLQAWSLTASTAHRPESSAAVQISKEINY